MSMMVLRATAFRVCEIASNFPLINGAARCEPSVLLLITGHRPDEQVVLGDCERHVKPVHWVAHNANEALCPLQAGSPALNVLLALLVYVRIAFDEDNSGDERLRG